MATVNVEACQFTVDWFASLPNMKKRRERHFIIMMTPSEQLLLTDFLHNSHSQIILLVNSPNRSRVKSGKILLLCCAISQHIQTFFSHSMNGIKSIFHRCLLIVPKWINFKFSWGRFSTQNFKISQKFYSEKIKRFMATGVKILWHSSRLPPSTNKIRNNWVYCHCAMDAVD